MKVGDRKLIGAAERQITTLSAADAIGLLGAALATQRVQRMGFATAWKAAGGAVEAVGRYR